MTLLALALALSIAVPAQAATSVTASVSVASLDSVTVSWTTTQDACFRSYTPQFKAPGASSWNDGATITNAQVTSSTIGGLQPGTTYTIRIRDADCVSQAFSNEVQATTAGGMISSTPQILLWILAGALVLVGYWSLSKIVKRYLDTRTVPQPPAMKHVAPSPSSPPAPPPKPRAPSPPSDRAPAAAFLSRPAANPADPNRPRWCARCGAPLRGPFCGQCRHKNW